MRPTYLPLVFVSRFYCIDTLLCLRFRKPVRRPLVTMKYTYTYINFSSLSFSSLSDDLAPFFLALQANQSLYSHPDTGEHK